MDIQGIIEQLIVERPIEGVTSTDMHKISMRASKRFRHILSYDELGGCITRAVWKAITKYDKSKAKFTTFLYRGVMIECMTQAKVERSYNKYSYLSVSHTSTVDPHYDLLELSEELVKGMRHIEYSDILYDKFFNHLSNKEIAEKHGCCSETIRVQVKKGIENLRENMKQCV